MSIHSAAVSDTSFVSAPDSPDAAKRQQLEQKLRIKKQKQAEKQYAKLRQMKDNNLIGKEFGNLADMEASAPVTVN